MRGISPVVAYVLLIAVIMIVGVGSYFWMENLVPESNSTGQKYVNPNTPIAITPIGSKYLLVSNLGVKPISTSTLKTNDPNVVVSCKDEEIPPGGQTTCELVGNSSSSTIAVYGFKTSVSIVQSSEARGEECSTINWYQPFLDWRYRQEIEIHGSGQTAYQVALNLDSSNVGENFDWSNKGIRFTYVSPDGLESEIPYWIEYWNATSKEAKIWIRVPFLQGNTTVYMYYGNPSASDIGDPDKVFLKVIDGLIAYYNATANRTVVFDMSGNGNNAKFGYIKFGNSSEAGYEGRFRPENGEGVGVIGTDGKYLYGMSWSSYDDNDHILTKIGTGYNGTKKAKDYGDVRALHSSISGFYLDGYFYNGYTSNGTNLERVNLETGEVDYQPLGGHLLNRGYGTNLTSASSSILITTDGRYVYNLAYRNYKNIGKGWTVRIFDPNDNWKLIKHINVSADSYYTDGIISDGNYIYAIQWSNKNTNNVTALDIRDLSQKERWQIDQGTTKAINGQYDWVNNKVWLGGLDDYNSDKDSLYLWDGHAKIFGEYRGSIVLNGYINRHSNDPYSDWKYKVPIWINNEYSNDQLTNYTIKIVVDTESLISAGKMRSDCGDIRFEDKESNTLHYWLQSGCNTNSTIIWVKVPLIPARDVPEIYMYYGNPSASSESDGEDTFEFFDDFSGDSLDTTKWEEHEMPNGKDDAVYSVSNSTFYIRGPSHFKSGGYGLGIFSKKKFGTGYSLLAYVLYENDYNGRTDVLGFSNPPPNYWPVSNKTGYVGYYGGSGSGSDGGRSCHFSNYLSGSGSTVDVDCFSSPVVLEVARFYDKTLMKLNDSLYTNTQNVFYGNASIAVWTGGGWADQGHYSEIKIDWVAVRRYTENDPETYVGHEVRVDQFDDSLGPVMIFDGFDDYLDCGNSPSLNSFSNGLSIEILAKQTSYTGSLDSWAVDKDYTGYRIWGKDKLYFDFRSPSQSWVIVEGPTPELNKWYYVVGTFDNDNLRASLYINGVLNATITVDEKYNFGYANVDLVLGKHSTQPRYWPGVIRFVRIYNHSLSAEEISDIYNNLAFVSTHYPGHLLIRKISDPEPLVYYLDEESKNWYYSGWPYKLNVSIYNSLTRDLNDYPVKIELNSSNFNFDHAKSDGSDIRVTTPVCGSEKPVLFWIEYWNSTEQKATIWVKVNLKANTTTMLYVYYGNQYALDGESSPKDIFTFFDDFGGSTLSDIWANTSSSGVVIGDGRLNITEGSVYSKQIFGYTPLGYAFEMKAQYSRFDQSYSGLMIADEQGTQGSNAGSNALVYVMTSGTSSVMTVWAADGSEAKYNIVSGASIYSSLKNDTDYVLGFVVLNSSYMKSYILSADGDILGVKTYTRAWNRPYYLWMGYFTGKNADNADIDDISIDWVRVRKVVKPEPRVTIGAEQSK